MAVDELFAFISQQIATIASIFVITLSAVWKLNKRADDRINALREEIKDTATTLKKENKEELDVANRILCQRLEYMERDITNLNNSIERLGETVRRYHEQH